MKWLARLKEHREEESALPGRLRNPRNGGSEGFEGGWVARIPSSEQERPTGDAIRDEIERHLVALLYDAPDEIPEALEVAMRDPSEALECFRSMVAMASAMSTNQTMSRARDCDRSSISTHGYPVPTESAYGFRPSKDR